MKIKNKIFKYLIGFLKLEWVLVVIIFYFYGELLKSNILQKASTGEYSVNGWDMSLQLMSDVYIIMYFIIPLVLYLSVITILSDFDYQTLIRIGSFKMWTYRNLKFFWKRNSMLLLIWVLISLIIMIGFPYSWDWSLFSQSKSNSNTLNVLTDHFELPIFAFIFQVISLLILISLLHIVIAVIYIVTKNKNITLLVCVAVYGGGLVASNFLPEELSFLSPFTYFSITKIVNSLNSVILISVILVIFTMICLFVLSTIDLNKKNTLNSVKPHFSVFIYFILCLLGLFTRLSSLEMAEFSIWDIWVLAFSGTGGEYFEYFSFMLYSIVFFGFVYIVNLHVNEEIGYLGYYKIIRYKNLKKWFWSWFKKILNAIVLLLFALAAAVMVIAVSMGATNEFYMASIPNQVYEVIYHFFINGFLQITFYILCVFIISWIISESISGTVLISVFMILMLPGINSLSIIPIGLNSMVYLLDYSPYYLTLILFIANFIVYSVVNFLLKKDFNNS